MTNLAQLYQSMLLTRFLSHYHCKWHFDSNVVETYVSYLRKKLDRLGPPLIHTIRLVGYSLRESQ